MTNNFYYIQEELAKHTGLFQSVLSEIDIFLEISKYHCNRLKPFVNQCRTVDQMYFYLSYRIPEGLKQTQDKNILEISSNFCICRFQITCLLFK